MPVRPADNTASSLASIATTLCAMPELNTATSQMSAMSRYIPVSDLTLLNTDRDGRRARTPGRCKVGACRGGSEVRRGRRSLRHHLRALPAAVVVAVVEER